MNGRWIILGDTRVNVEARTPAGESQAVVDATIRLFASDRAAPDYDEDGQPICTNPTGHEWVYTGTAYGGDDERWCGEGRVYCSHCGADGDS